jgi:VanZ family protein
MISNQKTAWLMTENKKYTKGIICVMITATLLIAGLWPFNFIPANKVKWLQNGNGIQFYGQGIVYSQKPLTIQEAASRNTSITIELLVRPHREINNMVSSMITLYYDDLEQFIFGQWKKELIIHIPAARADHNKHYREIGVENIFKKDTTHLITVTSGQKTTDIYIDGLLEKSFRHFSLIPKDQRLSGYLVLGNSPEGIHSWNGDIQGLALYDRILSGKEALDHYDAWQQRGELLPIHKSKPVALYLFDGHNNEKIHDYSGNGNSLLVPATFKPLHRKVLGMPEKDQWFSRSNLIDVTINIIGFVPFGFFLSAWLRLAKNRTASRAFLFSIILGACISLAIELIQAYLPTRDSSLLDVINNTMGTVAGALLFKYVLPVLHKIKGNLMLIS